VSVWLLTYQIEYTFNDFVTY